MTTGRWPYPTMTLDDNEIHLFITRPDDISNPGLLGKYAALLADEEHSKLSKFHHQRHRHQYLVTRALQRTSLSRYCDIEPADWRFTIGAYGKPEIYRPADQQSLKFNLSHTAGLIICGIAKTDIGVDVEDRQRSTRAAFSSLFSYFSAEEISQLESLTTEKQKHRFFEHWTLKESYIKARGAGFAIALNQFGFLFAGDHLKEFFTHEPLDDDANDWQFWQGCYGQRYPFAIALQSDKRHMKVILHECIPLQHSKTCDEIELRSFSNI